MPRSNRQKAHKHVVANNVVAAVNTCGAGCSCNSCATNCATTTIGSCRGYPLNADGRCGNCDEPYRIISPTTNLSALNLKAPACLLSDSLYLSLYNTLYDTVLTGFIEQALLNVYTVNTPAAYNAFITKIMFILNLTFPSISPRVVVSMQGGALVFDSFYDATVNTYDNWRNNAIGPNANTNISFMNAQSSKCSNSLGTVLKFTRNNFFIC
jgi:hypothetical protein